MFSKFVLSIFAFYGCSSARSILTSRDTTDTRLYAYGTNISGEAVFYGDGLAYIGDQAPDWLSVAANVTFATSGFDSSTAWSASSNATDFPSTSPILYIVPTTGSTAQVGFVASNSTAPTGAATEGLTFFGTSVAYVGSDEQYQLQFYAQETNTTGVWALIWNEANAVIENSVPVTLKSTGPLNLG